MLNIVSETATKMHNKSIIKHFKHFELRHNIFNKRG